MKILRQQMKSSELQMISALQTELAEQQTKLAEQQTKFAEHQTKLAAIIADLNDNFEVVERRSSECADTGYSLESILNLAAKNRKALN